MLIKKTQKRCIITIIVKTGKIFLNQQNLSHKLTPFSQKDKRQFNTIEYYNKP